MLIVGKLGMCISATSVATIGVYNSSTLGTTSYCGISTSMHVKCSLSYHSMGKLTSNAIVREILELKERRDSIDKKIKGLEMYLGMTVEQISAARKIISKPRPQS